MPLVTKLVDAILQPAMIESSIDAWPGDRVAPAGQPQGKPLFAAQLTMSLQRLFSRSKRLGMRPIPFLGTFLFVGLLFAIQQWLGARIWYQNIEFNLLPVIAAWELQYFLWGIFCWFLWLWLGDRLQKAGWQYILSRILPLSILMGVVVEMALAAAFPQFPVRRTPMNFWQRLDFSLTEEFLENTAVFWGAFLVIRAIGYYRESRQRERDMSQLAVELTEARMLALRMQINPHFLFNTMNSVSSLMYTDVRAADRMLEQLCSLLRVSLERGPKQLICLQQEIEFIEMYLSLQDLRAQGSIRQQIHVDPRLYDALVPNMILQPIVENAYVHGLSRVTGGSIAIEAKEEAGRISISVRNSGMGLRPAKERESSGMGIGLNNVRKRLRLHFGERCQMTIGESAPDQVEVKLEFPLTFAIPNEEPAHDPTAELLHG
jgi:two-component system, LytTR family, sensor kinase